MLVWHVILNRTSQGEANEPAELPLPRARAKVRSVNAIASVVHGGADAMHNAMRCTLSHRCTRLVFFRRAGKGEQGRTCSKSVHACVAAPDNTCPLFMSIVSVGHHGPSTIGCIEVRRYDGFGRLWGVLLLWACPLMQLYGFVYSRVKSGQSHWGRCMQRVREPSQKRLIGETVWNPTLCGARAPCSFKLPA